MGRVTRCLAVLGVVASVALASESINKDGSNMKPRDPLSIDHPDVVEAANFAVTELQDLSDSGVYHSLKLTAIKSAASQEGVYHHNIFLTLELSSPHLKTPSRDSLYDVIVMRSKEDGVRSFAIDEFPIMDEDAIEEYWIQKVERHRAMREDVFAQLEAEFEKEELARKLTDGSR